MTKHELAAATWREIRDDLIDRGVYNDSALEADKELNDQVQIARIENAFVAAVAAVEAETEDRVSQTDNAKLEIPKPVDGYMTVISKEFSKYDGKVVLRANESMIISQLHGQVYVTKRQG